MQNDTSIVTKVIKTWKKVKFMNNKMFPSVTELKEDLIYWKKILNKNLK